MPEMRRPDGATIHYETYGSGYPLLLFAPGGVNSEIEFWDNSAIQPIREFASEFLVIAMDQRNAGRSFAPLVAPRYEEMVADQLAVLNELGITRAHVMGGCIGVAYCLRILAEAPARIMAAVCQDPVGLDGTNSHAVFFAMFEPTIALAREQGMAAVVRSALENPLFVRNNAAGPFARRIAGDAAFRDRVQSMGVNEYVAVIEAYKRSQWPERPLFSVEEDQVQGFAAPLLVLPGSDPFHPTGVARRICELAPVATMLDVDCRSEAKLGATIETVCAFLRQHAS